MNQKTFIRILLVSCYLALSVMTVCTDAAAGGFSHEARRLVRDTLMYDCFEKLGYSACVIASNHLTYNNCPSVDNCRTECTTKGYSNIQQCKEVCEKYFK